MCVCVCVCVCVFYSGSKDCFHMATKFPIDLQWVNYLMISLNPAWLFVLNFAIMFYDSFTTKVIDDLMDILYFVMLPIQQLF